MSCYYTTFLSKYVFLYILTLANSLLHYLAVKQLSNKVQPIFIGLFLSYNYKIYRIFDGKYCN